MLHLLHPFMPYITEELWAQFVGSEQLLIKAAWPVLPDALVKKEAQSEIHWLIRLISAVRTVRAELNVPAAAKIRLEVKDANATTQKYLTTHADVIERMARLSAHPSLTKDVAKGAAQTIVDEATLILPLADVIDLEQERARLAKEGEKWAAEIKKIEAKLANKDFVDRAPPEVVEEHQSRKAEAQAMIAKLQAAQKSLAG
jgi:valyl-tRNA synthetase